MSKCNLQNFQATNHDVSVVQVLEPDPRIEAYKVFFQRVEIEYGKEVLELCRSRVLAELDKGRMVAGQVVLESLMRERRPVVSSKPGSVRFVY